VEEVADRIGIILQGQLVLVGRCVELKQQVGQNASLEDAFLRIVEDRKKA
jgi:ABC-type multidrug transport system ATPase subunit